MFDVFVDAQTGGLRFSECDEVTTDDELRPVYSKELDLLGLDSCWKYEAREDVPYMWSTNDWKLIYRGVTVAQVTDVSLDGVPTIEHFSQPESDGSALRPVDINAMREQCAPLIEKAASKSIEDIRRVYEEYKDKIDLFYVAYSTGKDSTLLLDLVRRALPAGEFTVMYCDTGMEIEESKRMAQKTKEQCEDEGIPFIWAISHLDPADTWTSFGPPATYARWCCSVHKSTPMVLSLREHMGSDNFTPMTFIGIRHNESIYRSTTQLVQPSYKVKGTYECRPILRWSSAELYAYALMYDVEMNEGYRYGLSRIGCVVCPCAPDSRANWEHNVLREGNENVFRLLDCVSESYKQAYPDSEERADFVSKYTWSKRRDGSEIDQTPGYREVFDEDGNRALIGQQQLTSWKTWIRTIGTLSGDGPDYTVTIGSTPFEFSVHEHDDGSFTATFSDEMEQRHTKAALSLRRVFRKAACCTLCRTCEANCPHGHMSMKDGKLEISDDCLHCSLCHKPLQGCLRYHSLAKQPTPQEEYASKALVRYPADGGVPSFRQLKEWDFAADAEPADAKAADARPDDTAMAEFSTFLRDAELIDAGGKPTTYAKLFEERGWNDAASWQIAFANLARFQEVCWLVRRIPFDEPIRFSRFCELCEENGVPEDQMRNLWKSYLALCALPLSPAGIGSSSGIGTDDAQVIRNKPVIGDPLVVLHSLYRFMLASRMRNRFPVKTFYNGKLSNLIADPTLLYGISEDDLADTCKELAERYPDYIQISPSYFVTLNANKTPEDIADLLLGLGHDVSVAEQPNGEEMGAAAAELPACSSCDGNAIDSDVMALNQKLYGKDVKRILCLDCMSKELGCTVSDLLDKIEEFKEEGCTLFA